MALTIYGDLISGNCQKVKFTADKLGLAYDWVAVDIGQGEARTPEFRKLNAAAQVPTVVFEDGRSLAQSNAIILHLAQGSALIPQDAYYRAKMLEWLFWEQNSHEPYIAVRRRQKLLLKRTDDEIDPSLLERGEAALARMETWLAGSPFLVDGALSLADIALLAYTRMAGQGGYDLSRFPAVQAWIGRVEGELGLEAFTS
jgi:glutathione S-transferase